MPPFTDPARRQPESPVQGVLPPETGGETAAGGEIRSLTGLRGLAALGIVAYHFLYVESHDFLAQAGLVPQPLLDLMKKGYLAVDVFFILSGFVLAYRYAAAFAGGVTARTVGWFLAHRLGRVYPLHATLTLLVSAAIFFKNGYANLDHPLAQNIANFTLTQAWGFGTLSLILPAWSVSTEFFAYLLFPLLLGATLACPPRRAAATGLAALALLAVVAFAQDGRAGRNGALDFFDGETVLPLLRCLGGFILGLLTYRLHQASNGRGNGRGSAAARILRSDGAVAAVLAGLAALAALHAHDLLLYPLLPPLILVAAAQGRLARALFATPLPYGLGVVSYSLYLCHYRLGDMALLPLQARLAPLFGAGAAYAAALGLVGGGALVLALLCFRLIEAPARRQGRRLAAWFGPEAGGPCATEVPQP